MVNRRELVDTPRLISGSAAMRVTVQLRSGATLIKATSVAFIVLCPLCTFCILKNVTVIMLVFALIYKFDFKDTMPGS